MYMYFVFVAYYNAMISVKYVHKAVISRALFHLQLYKPGWSNLGTKWARLAPNATHLGLFQIRIQYILAR